MEDVEVLEGNGKAVLLN